MTAKAVPWRPSATDARAPLCTMLENGEHHGEMRLMEGRYGRFWGCRRYPECAITIDAQKWDRDEASRLGYGEDDEEIRWDR